MSIRLRRPAEAELRALLCASRGHGGALVACLQRAGTERYLDAMAAAVA